MRRDDDLIRHLLMGFEAATHWELEFVRTMGMREDDEKELYHVLLLQDQGLVASEYEGVYRLTAQGHDYLEAIRDEGIWAKTKAIVAEEGGNATICNRKPDRSGATQKKFY